MIGFTGLRTVIKAKLDTITQFAFVDDKHHDQMSGYPAVTFETDSFSSEPYTNTDNLNRYKFSIYLHQEMAVSGRDEAMRRLNLAIDAIIAAFNSDYNLGNNISFSKDPEITKGEYGSGAAASFYALMIYEAVVEESRT